MDDDRAVEIRRATAADVPAIVAMLADDPLGATRESPGDPVYAAAFAEIDADPRQYLAVAAVAGAVVGTLQLTFIPGLSRRGATRALIEAVRVRSDQRGSGLGRLLAEWAIETARARGRGDGAADHGREPGGRAPVLRAARLRREPRGHEADLLARRRPRPGA